MSEKCCCIPVNNDEKSNNYAYCTGVAQGNTPTITFKTNAPLIDIRTIRVTFQQLGVTIVERDSFTIIDENKFTITLTQEETLLFSAKYPFAINRVTTRLFNV